MSADQSSTALDAQTVAQIASLARLNLDQTQADQYAQSLTKILGMMENLKQIDTDGVEPLRHPFDHPQPLRADVVSEINQRDAYQTIAPATQDGLYLVPRVIE